MLYWPLLLYSIPLMRWRPPALLRPFNNLYYRLRQADIDGKFTYSNIVIIKIAGNTQTGVAAFPNPFKQSITLQIITVMPTDKTDLVTLYSIDGRILCQKKLAQKGSGTLLLNDLPPLGQGIYLLQTSIQGKLYTIKMIRD
jgi:hypothetical protein